MMKIINFKLPFGTSVITVWNGVRAYERIYVYTSIENRVTRKIIIVYLYSYSLFFYIGTHRLVHANVTILEVCETKKNAVVRS